MTGSGSGFWGLLICFFFPKSQPGKPTRPFHSSRKCWWKIQGCCIPGSSSQRAGFLSLSDFQAGLPAGSSPKDGQGFLPVQAARQEWQEARKRPGEAWSPFITPGIMNWCCRPARP